MEHPALLPKETQAHLTPCNHWAERHYYGEQTCGVVWERKRQNALCLMDRDIPEEVKSVRSEPMWLV